MQQKLCLFKPVLSRFGKIASGSSKWGKQPVPAESISENKTVVEGMPPNVSKQKKNKKKKHT